MEFAVTALSRVLSTFGKLTLPCAKRYARDIVMGLQYLHANDVIHRDVKPQNVLLGQSGYCKLADFGTASLLTKLEQNAEMVMGTPHYMAPELIRGQIGRPADVWALGVTVWQMLTGALLDDVQEMTNTAAVMFHVGMMTKAPQIPHEFSDEVKLFLRSCLNLEPQERGTADELLGEPFLTVPAPDTPTNLFQRAPTTII